MALRPRLSAGLLFSDVDYIIATSSEFSPFISVKSTYRIETILPIIWGEPQQTSVPNLNFRWLQYRSEKRRGVHPHRLD